MSRLFILALAAALLSGLRPAPAGDASPIKPSNQPLAVARATRPANVERLLATRQIQYLGLANADYSGSLPGLGVRLESLRRFAGALAANDGRSLWYCLMQRGSLINQTAALGWSWPEAAGDDIAAWLRENAFNPDGLALEAKRIGGNRLAFAAARDAASLKEVDGGGTEAGTWRRDLDAFMRGGGNGVGVWLNPRPLLGFASLTTGLDFRRLAGGGKVNLPETLSLEVSREEDDLGLELRLNRVLPEAWDDDHRANFALVGENDNALLSVHIPNPGRMLETMGWSGRLFPANISLDALMPGTMRIDVRRGGDGAPRWTVIGDMAGMNFHGNYARLLSWLDLILPAPGAKAEIPGWESVRRYSWNGFTFFVGTATIRMTDDSNTYLVITGNADGFPDPEKLRPQNGESRLLGWNISLDAAEKARLADILADMGARFRVRGLTAEMIRAALPEKESGNLYAEGNSLRLASPRGLALWTAPLFAAMLGDARAALAPDPARLASARLRFLLGVANQYRYRRVGPGRLEPAELPDTLSVLAFSDPDGRRWLDRSFPAFPGGGIAASEALRLAAAGNALDGYVFRIVGENGEWALSAENRRGDALRLDSRGVLRRMETGGTSWREIDDETLVVF